MHHELTLARALRDQLHRAMAACTADLAQTSAILEDALAKLRERHPTTGGSRAQQDQRCAL